MDFTCLRYHQRMRVSRCMYESFYLLDCQPLKDDVIQSFKVSGSTRSVYCVSFRKDMTLECDCPDSLNHCKKLGVVCKHTCFVLLRVLKYNSHAFFKGCKLNTHDFEILTTLCQSIHSIQDVGDQEIINEELTKRYTDLQDASSLESFKPVKTICHDDECPICYQALNDEDTLCACPMCHNNVHKECVVKWLEHSSQKTCVYCRSANWTYYYDKYVNPHPSDHTYVQL